MINFRDDVLPLKNRLYRLALRITLNTGEAEDIVQETMIKVWQHREELESPSSVEAYSITVCHNMALDSLTKKESQNESLDKSPYDALDNANSPFQTLSQNDRKIWVYKLFAKLPEKQRTIIQLRDIENKTYKEISTILALSEEQVKVTLFRARQRIKQEFEKIDNYGL